MKMIIPEMEVIRFEAADVIATSSPIPATKWSQYSYKPFGADFLKVPDFSGKIKVMSTAGIGLSEGVDYVDGIEQDDPLSVFDTGSYYHYDTEAVGTGLGKIPYCSNWKTCTDESHHYNGQ